MDAVRRPLPVPLPPPMRAGAAGAAAAPTEPRETPTRQGLEAVSRLAEEETRIAKAGVLAEAIAEAERANEEHERPTSISRHPIDAAPASQRGASRSTSGVSSRGGDDRVAAIRELYAQGNAEAALAIASEVASDFAAASGPATGSLPPGIDPYGGLIPIDEDPYGGLQIVEEDDPADCTAIVEPSADSRRLASMTSQSMIPRLLVGPKELAKMPIDPRAAFIASYIDGIQSMEEILDVCAMPEAEALELIERLRTLGVIALG